MEKKGLGKCRRLGRNNGEHSYYNEGEIMRTGEYTCSSVGGGEGTVDYTT